MKPLSLALGLEGLKKNGLNHARVHLRQKSEAMAYMLVIKSDRGRWVATLTADPPVKAYGSSAAEAAVRLFRLLRVLESPDLLPECGGGSAEENATVPAEFDRAA